MKRSILAVLGILTLASLTLANDEDRQKREQDRLQNANLVMQEILKVPDNIPKDLLDRARCVISDAFGAQSRLRYWRRVTDAGPWSAGQARISQVHGVPPRCTRSKAGASASRLAAKQLTSCF